MAVIPPKQFKSHNWLLTNAMTGEPMPKVMESIKWTAWRLSTEFVREKGYWMQPLDVLSVDGAKVLKWHIDQHGTTGVISAIKKGYQFFKFV